LESAAEIGSLDEYSAALRVVPAQRLFGRSDYPRHRTAAAGQVVEQSAVDVGLQVHTRSTVATKARPLKIAPIHDEIDDMVLSSDSGSVSDIEFTPSRREVWAESTASHGNGVVPSAGSSLDVVDIFDLGDADALGQDFALPSDDSFDPFEETSFDLYPDVDFDLDLDLDLHLDPKAR